MLFECTLLSLAGSRGQSLIHCPAPEIASLSSPFVRSAQSKARQHRREPAVIETVWREEKACEDHETNERDTAARTHEEAVKDLRTKVKESNQVAPRQRRSAAETREQRTHADGLTRRIGGSEFAPTPFPGISGFRRRAWTRKSQRCRARSYILRRGPPAPTGDFQKSSPPTSKQKTS